MHPKKIFSLPAAVRGAKAVTLGVFDGVHLGHRAILSRVIEVSPDDGLALTFRPHPDEILWGRSVRWVASAEVNRARLQETGIAHVSTIPFSKELSQVSAVDFAEYLFFDQLQSPTVVLGFNQRFGQDGLGNAAWLAETFADRLQVICIDPVMHEGGPVSSTRVREAIMLGELQRVADLLGGPFVISGEVVEGFKRGRQLGFPTANIVLPEGQVVPPFGVYAVDVTWQNRCVPAVANLGVRPTFEVDDRPCLEVHIPNFEGDLYGQILGVIWKSFVRPERKFSGRDELVKQIQNDVDQALDGS